MGLTKLKPKDQENPFLAGGPTGGICSLFILTVGRIQLLEVAGLRFSLFCWLLTICCSQSLHFLQSLVYIPFLNLQRQQR